MNLHKQNFVCWPSVGPQDIKQTYIHTLPQRGVIAGTIVSGVDSSVTLDLAPSMTAQTCVTLHTWIGQGTAEPENFVLDTPFHIYVNWSNMPYSTHIIHIIQRVGCDLRSQRCSPIR